MDKEQEWKLMKIQKRDSDGYIWKLWLKVSDQIWKRLERYVYNFQGVIETDVVD
jgi:hypothetical protein